MSDTRRWRRAGARWRAGRRRRWVRRIPPWVSVGVGCVLAGATIGFAGAHLAASSVIGHYVSPGEILISTDQRTLTASAGSCETGSLIAIANSLR
jgi:hypothetical protein